MNTKQPCYVAIACGGTGGHLFPGLAVAEALSERDCDVALIISQKEVDQEAVKSASHVEVIALPAVALQNGEWINFVGGFWKSYRLAKRAFASRKPHAVLAMGGFTSAAPVVAAKRSGAATFLHEANAIPGRANRWLSPFVDAAFVGYAMGERRLHNQRVHRVGTPVRSHFKPADGACCRISLGLRPSDPVLLVTGGSQGASAINRLVCSALPIFAQRRPHLQFLHLTGRQEVDEVTTAYRKFGLRAVVRPFLTEMELALGAATVAVSRAGSSSIAEMAAMRVPALLIPYPAAVDNHQFYNARPLGEAGAAKMFEQSALTPELLAAEAIGLLDNESARQQMCGQLSQWHFPNAADEIAGRVYAAARERAGLAALPVVAPSISNQAVANRMNCSR